MIYLWLTWLCFPLLWWRAQRNLRRQPAVTNIALIQTAKIGDFVCTTPLFREIKRRYPACHLVVIGHRMNEPLARHNPHIDEFLCLPTQGLRGVSGRRWLVGALVKRNIDTSICVSPSLPSFLAPLWAGVPRRLAVLPNYGGNSYRHAAALLTHGEIHVAGRLLLDTEWALLSALDIYPHRQEKEAWTSPEGKDAVAAWLGGEAQLMVGIGVSAGNKLKELGEARLTELTLNIIKSTSAKVVLIGGPDDRELAENVAARLPATQVVNAVGHFDLSALPALLQRLEIYVGVDSGITYLAEASGVNVVDVMGPADADDQRPTGANAVIFRSDLPCAPCSHAFKAPYRCAIGTIECIKAFDISAVSAVVTKCLKERDG